MAVNTASQIKRKGHATEEIEGLGTPKIHMWKLESVTEIGDREPVWVKCGPFSIAMVRDLRAKGFREAPPASPVEAPAKNVTTTTDHLLVIDAVETPEAKVELPEQELLKCDYPRCKFETHSKPGLTLHGRKHKEKIKTKD